MQAISIAITTFQRFDFTLRSFEKVLDDERISEIVISDDASTDGSYEKLCEHFKDDPKVKLFQNEVNQNMSKNKALAVERSSNPWVIIFDSDNILDKKYLDAVEKMYPWYPNTFYQPSFALDRFDFRKWQNIPITKSNVAQFMEEGMFRVSLNGHNAFVNRGEYLKNYEYNPDIKGADSIFFIFNWLSRGNVFYITPELEYIHTIHDSSGFMENIEINMKHAIELEQKIRELK